MSLKNEFAANFYLAIDSAVGEWFIVDVVTKECTWQIRKEQNISEEIFVMDRKV
ncbi:MAG: hypothetical protein HFH05_12690 [Lachnospiraceae bacterium]|nr:hypothetical protein [Lachnospiraceae bacterium]